MQAARLALRLAGRIVGPVFLEKHGPRVENFGFNFKELGKWCNKELRATNVLTTMVLNAPGLLGDPVIPIAASMGELIDGVVSVQEDLVIELFENFRTLPEMIVVEIPEAERNPINLRRFRVGLRGTDC